MGGCCLVLVLVPVWGLCHVATATVVEEAEDGGVARPGELLEDGLLHEAQVLPHL